ncbi:MAG: ATP-binding protein [Simkaniaceae bacterium]|nr:ATP-binding protein [Candidatus Sacchlamyda saccharinae]
MSFRKKVILSQIITFVIFFAALFPFVEKMAAILVKDSLIESTNELKDSLSKVASEQEMIDLIKKQQYYSFFRITLISNKLQVVYDVHMARLEGDQFKPYSPTEHGELTEALEKGVGYVIATSDTFGGKFAYIAEAFPFKGETWIIRTSFPYNQIQDLTNNFELGLLIFCFFVLLFFNALIWFILNRLTQPIREIIHAITPYQKGEQAELPAIKLAKATAPNDQFQRLASAFNSLSKKIQEQINDLMSERNEKEAILESLGEGVIAVNEKMTVLYINFIACKMLGVSRRNVLEKPLPTDSELLKKCEQLLSYCQQNGTIATDSYVYGQESKTYIDLVAAPKAHGTGAIVVLQDKTSHYRVLEMGKDFVANASHELRTPITIIKGYAETLHDMPELKPAQIAEITEKIGRSCVRMESLVSNLLTLADIDNLPESRFAECDLISLLENAQHTIQAVYPNAKLTLAQRKEPILIGADAGLLELAFINILDNAVKYSKPPATVTIDVTLTEDREAQINITDQGRGIPAEDIDHIFDRFYRVDKTHSRKLGGAGLGLSIVKTIITKHDGTITATSELGHGTTFTILIPLRHHGRL